MSISPFSLSLDTPFHHFRFDRPLFHPMNPIDCDRVNRIFSSWMVPLVCRCMQIGAGKEHGHIGGPSWRDRWVVKASVGGRCPRPGIQAQAPRRSGVERLGTEKGTGHCGGSPWARGAFHPTSHIHFITKLLATASCFFGSVFNRFSDASASAWGLPRDPNRRCVT